LYDPPSLPPCLPTTATTATTQIAGVILEPVVGNGGFIPPTKEFLQGLREITTAEGAVLCFDEVMTGFRIAKVRQHFSLALRCRGVVMMIDSWYGWPFIDCCVFQQPMSGCGEQPAVGCNVCSREIAT
jgi:hypothetical protein